MGNLPWLFVLLIPSLGFIVFLVYVNIRLSRRRKALGLPPLGLTPRRGKTGHRKHHKYVIIHRLKH